MLYAYLRVVSFLAPPPFNPFSKKDWKASRALSSDDPAVSNQSSHLISSMNPSRQEAAHRTVRTVPSLGFTLSANAFTMVSAPTKSNDDDDDDDDDDDKENMTEAYRQTLSSN